MIEITSVGNQFLQKDHFSYDPIFDVNGIQKKKYGIFRAFSPFVCIYNWIFVPHKTFIIKQDKNLNEGEDIVFILMMISFSFIYSLTSVMFSLSVFSGLVFSSGIFWWAFFFWLVVFCFSVAPWSSILILVWYFWVSNDLQEACLLYWTAVF